MKTKKIIFKIIKTIFVIGIMFFLLIILAYSETHYTRTGFVKRKAVTLNTYYFYDSTGNIWEFDTDENLNPDMNIEVKIYNNCTIDDIKDDMIIDYKVLPSELKIEIEK